MFSIGTKRKSVSTSTNNYNLRVLVFNFLLHAVEVFKPILPIHFLLTLCHRCLDHAQLYTRKCIILKKQVIPFVLL